MFFGARGFSLPPNGTSIGSARRCIHRHPDPQTVKLMCNVYTCIQQQAAPMRCGPKPNATLGLVSGTACISICAATIAVITTASVVAAPPLTPLIRNRVSRRDCRRPDQNKPELDCRVWRSLSVAFFYLASPQHTGAERDIAIGFLSVWPSVARWYCFRATGFH